MTKPDELTNPEDRQTETADQKAMSDALQKMAQQIEGNTPQQEKGLADQPSWETIKKLQKESEFTRSSETTANCVIEIEGKKYTIETIERGDDPRLHDVQKLFERTFGKEEVDPEEVLRNAVDGHTASGQPDNKYRIITVRNEKGKLVSTFTGGVLELLDEKGESTGESVYSVGYAVTDKRNREKGLAKEAYISALIDATKEAEADGKTLKMAIGECTYTSEKFWNRVGWKRVYSQKEGEKSATELKYIQPALDFDTETGKPTEDAGEAPEHLMIDSFGSGIPGKQEVAMAYEALVHYNADWPEEEFDSPDAFKNHTLYMKGIKDDFTTQLNSAEVLIFMDATAREEAQKTGTTIYGHNGADHGDTGKEDF